MRPATSHAAGLPAPLRFRATAFLDFRLVRIMAHLFYNILAYARNDMQRIDSIGKNLPSPEQYGGRTCQVIYLLILRVYSY
jgi:hypothetical protein